MKNILTNLIVLAGIAIAYYFDIFGWFVGGKAKIFSLVLVGIVFIIAVKVLGNPFKQDEKDEDK